MKKLISRRYIIRQNLFSIIGMCLICYFSYHALLGERSYIKLVTLEHEIAALSFTHAAEKAAREQIERHVVMMRPDSMDRDLAEERVRYVLGYGRDDDLMVMRLR